MRRLLATAFLLAPLAMADDEIAWFDCTATVSLDYLQRGDEVQVDMTVENPHCAASEGTFVIEATVRGDGADEAQKLRFPESWQRDDDATVEMSRLYPIGDNVDLLRIRIRKLTCACTNPAENE